LILELVRFGHVEAENPLHRAIGTAFLAMLGEAKPLPHMLAMPIDRRAQRVAAAIVADPAARDVPLARIAGESGASLRTIQRRFLDETGMSLSEWRQVVRLMVAAARLIDGESVTNAALSAGYTGTSAFVHAFRKKFGETPSIFWKTGGARKP
jgi:AraC-like DNA-binding protein